MHSKKPAFKKVRIKIDPLNERLSRYRTFDGKIGYLLIEKEKTVIVTLGMQSMDDMILGGRPPKNIELPKENVDEINEDHDKLIIDALLRVYKANSKSSQFRDETEKTNHFAKYTQLRNCTSLEALLDMLKHQGYSELQIVKMLGSAARMLTKMLVPPAISQLVNNRQ